MSHSGITAPRPPARPLGAGPGSRTGAKEVKQASDGLPRPILLRLGRGSTFNDMTYLTRQVNTFACHSWQQLLPVAAARDDPVLGVDRPACWAIFPRSRSGTQHRCWANRGNQVVPMSDVHSHPDRRRTAVPPAGDRPRRGPQRPARSVRRLARAGGLPGLGIDGAAEVAAKASGAERHFAHVAVLGLAAQVRTLGDKEREALVAGLNVTVNRDPVVAGTPMGFCMDGVVLAAR